MLTQEYLKELFEYNGEDLIWGVKRRGTKGFGSVAGCVNSYGYRQIQVDGKAYKAHRLIWLYNYGKFPDNQTDHIDQNRLNNKLNNLRDVTRQENQKNRSKSKRNTSGVTGVNWHKPTGKWMAYGKVDGKQIHLGRFTDKLDAIVARKSFEAKHNFHANHGS